MEWDIAYNTTQEELIFSEYGRAVQELLRNANNVEDDDERQAYVERVIKLMLQMQPGIKTQDKYEERLWRHAFQIAGEPLKVQLPEGVTLEPATEEKELEPLPYPESTVRMRHYGQHVQDLIKAAMAMEDGPERDLATYTAAYYMKIALSSWDQGKFVNEDMIRKDLYELSERKLVLPPDAKLGEPGPNQPAQHDDKKKKKKSKNRSMKQTIQPPQVSRPTGGHTGGGGGGSKSRNRNKRRR
ncbi:DUF4290 domain-containing protein [Neolewinella lacunae]|uniref:DUF4290 domain-containing protein n=1 Tax=Neolewinella lacunae TaxID=1517758 RepID=A0A923T8G3_9BACT|nr:DUF4290 domain-containing protein [Neolewinella lacunae]MBC6993928.1 DUF4290 domain-containing protein [Neolewinella lacunae]MDN3634991.1 DUF4290 domain-containing protein [Neolewinella lacunae]